MSVLETILSNPQSYFSVKQVSEAMRVSRQTVDYFLRNETIPYALINNKRFVKGKDLRDYLLKKRSKGFRSVREILKIIN